MSHENDDDDLRAEAQAERRERNYWHWCETCIGISGPGSPCRPEPKEEPKVEADEGDDE